VADSAQVCSKFFGFPDGQRINWPLTLAPGKSRIVFSQDDSVPDTDGDGIGDPQDACPATPARSVVDAKGCALYQQ
jgi:hypothetical protein